MIDGKQVSDWAAEKVLKQHLPLPAKPKGKEPEFEYPSDPTAITLSELGQWMLKLAGWHGYAIRLVGVADAELTALSAEYEMRVNSLGSEVRAELGRVNAQVVEATVLQNHPELEPLFKRRLELSTVKVHLDTRARIYEKLWNALSRELARREMEIRIT